MSRIAIVLAAGQGTRMKSSRGKVLHELCGRPMLHHVLDAALAAGMDELVVVVGHDGDNVQASLARYGNKARAVRQDQQLGTGHAVGCALPALGEQAELAMILCGDTPLVRAEDLERLAHAFSSPEGGAESTHPGHPNLALLTCRVPEPSGYGRIVRGQNGRVSSIVEHRDASDEQRQIQEINPAMYLARVPFLRGAVSALKPNNAQGELYFTDVVAHAASQGGALAVLVDDAGSLVGINDRVQLAAAEEALYARTADSLRRRGVTIHGRARIDVGVVVEPEAEIEDGVHLRGATRIGSGARLDVGCVLSDVTVASNARLLPYTIASKSRIGEGAQVGPFSHLRQDSDIGPEAHIGNFVETKKTIMHQGAKANHLAYLGDGEIGKGANVGAGTIFCNYDGFRKHKTDIGEGAFIGSDSQLVAPIRIGDGAYVATGTTVTKDVPDNALAIGRTKQENKEGYASRLRARLKAQK